MINKQIYSNNDNKNNGDRIIIVVVTIIIISQFSHEKAVTRLVSDLSATKFKGMEPPSHFHFLFLSHKYEKITSLKR